jgi:group I intron endonuclease
MGVYTIYAIQNKIDGKAYIGKTVRPIKERWKHHKYDHYRKDYPLYRAMRKYGIQNFRLTILWSGECAHDELLRREIAYISLFGTRNPESGYNLHVGGAGQQRCNPSLETRERNRISNLGKKRSVESRGRMSKSKMGVKLSSETRAAMSRARKGVRHGHEWGLKIGLSKVRRSKGYYFDQARAKWIGRFVFRGEEIYLGAFESESEVQAAVIAAKQKAGVYVSRV